jgi:poly(3-hydroxybutyrate) depolymerase
MTMRHPRPANYDRAARIAYDRAPMRLAPTLAVALGAGVLAAGCGGTDRPSPPAPRAPAASTPAPVPRGNPVRFRATDGVRLRGRLVPAGRGRAPAVVLVHQSDGGPEQFDDFLRYLHAAGYSALVYVSRPMPGRMDETANARDVAGAVRMLRHRPRIDPRRIAVVGASIGGAAAAYLAFTRTGRSLPAIVGLSPADFAGDPPRGRHPHDVLLIADSTERSSADFIAQGSTGIEVRTSPARGHGVALLPDARVRGWVLGWLRARLAR